MRGNEDPTNPEYWVNNGTFSIPMRGNEISLSRGADAADKSFRSP